MHYTQQALSLQRRIKAESLVKFKSFLPVQVSKAADR